MDSGREISELASESINQIIPVNINNHANPFLVPLGYKDCIPN